jgi:hypothetical protein
VLSAQTRVNVIEALEFANVIQVMKELHVREQYAQIIAMTEENVCHKKY